MSAVEAIVTLLTKAFGFAVGNKNWEDMSRDHQLKTLSEGIDKAIENGDDATADALFNHYRELRRKT